MKTIATISILLTFAFASAALAQDPDWPNGWIDLQADSIIYDFPYPDSISIRVVFSIMSGMLVDSFFVSDMGIFLDGVPIYSSPIEISNVATVCAGKDEADCSGECEIQLYPSGTKDGNCRWLNDTLLVRCACREGSSWWPISAGYLSNAVITFELDMAGSIDEPYENNNYISVSLIPVAVDPATWGRIKKEYDK